jgi:hypothetical protein
MPTTSPATKDEADVARLEAEIRASVQREDFTRTVELFEQYRIAVEQCLRSASNPQATSRSLSGRVQDLLEWVRRMTLLSRSKYQARFNVLSDASRYLAAYSARLVNPTFRVRG